jgi:hypothetical protein
MTMAEASSKRARRPNVGPVPDVEDPKPAAEHPAPVCTVAFCPICLAVTAMQPIRPDVVEHLLTAGRELMLAARAVLEARDEVPRDGGSSRLEKIDIG